MAYCGARGWLCHGLEVIKVQDCRCVTDGLLMHVGSRQLLAKALLVILPVSTATTLLRALFLEVLSWHSIALVSTNLHVKALSQIMRRATSATLIV